ncbi:uncharacterized protein I206_107135 [Kwoniella pini CBS 10737]|uniref:FAD dependent oxidoreductase domain-containing protein n=1 Tax=Kwoniella pini CBS 10737 TaxID=1296096 RepID=A0A1B9HZ34_9TREE|nr:uncharacterized protein I206_05321 [Kwoniella pini CBS 10737]OCF48542.1 hypothetical protein I206_05321 [Kwoniella pini CBS 10737]
MSSSKNEVGLPPVGMENSSISNLKLIDNVLGLPIESGMSMSHWLGTVRNNPLLDLRSSEKLPASAEVVIIGSGISGALTALNLLESRTPPNSIVMLEARELCSGATGRNAGHCKPDLWRGFTEYAKRFGNDQALKILANEKETREALVKFIEDNKIQCEVWNGKTMDVMMDNTVVEKAAETMKAFKAAGGDASFIDVILNPAEAEDISRVKGAKAVYASPASTLHPWKLVEFVIKRCLRLGLNVQTLTPVTSISGSNNKWIIHTDRGDIRTSTVIHNTNAYAGYLLPETKKSITPIPHMCNLVYPPSSHSGSKGLSNSYAVIYTEGLFSINPRSTSDGAILFGGVQPAQDALESFVKEKAERQYDDRLKDFQPITECVKTLGGNVFDWDKPPKPGFAVRYDRSWSGIIGLSSDEVPFVGAVPGKAGQWMSCGHNGHGMARIFTCSRGLAKLVQGSSWVETGLPECFQVTRERLNGQAFRPSKL